MASTPSINPSQLSARNTEEGARFNRVLFSTLDALEEAGIPFALIGGVAAAGLGRPRSTDDIDVFVRPEAAPRAAHLRAVERHPDPEPRDRASLRVSFRRRAAPRRPARDAAPRPRAAAPSRPRRSRARLPRSAHLRGAQGGRPHRPAGS